MSTEEVIVWMFYAVCELRSSCRINSGSLLAWLTQALQEMEPCSPRHGPPGISGQTASTESCSLQDLEQCAELGQRADPWQEQCAEFEQRDRMHNISMAVTMKAKELQEKEHSLVVQEQAQTQRFADIVGD